MEEEKEISYHNTLIVLLLLVYFFVGLVHFLVSNQVFDANTNEDQTYLMWVNPDNID